MVTSTGIRSNEILLGLAAGFSEFGFIAVHFSPGPIFRVKLNGTIILLQVLGTFVEAGVII